MIFGGLFIILLYGYFNFNFLSENEKGLQQYFIQLTQNNVELAKSLVAGLKSDRQTIFMSDFIRSLVYILLTIAFIFIYIKRGFKPIVLVVGILLLTFIDEFNVSNRYLNADLFVEKKEFDESVFKPSEIDKQIMSDSSNPRVLDLSKDPFNDAMPSYFHRNIGGYSPAKLSIYEDLLNFQLRKKINVKVLDMLNCKYVINKNENGQPQLQFNPTALGYAWLVNKIVYQKSPKLIMNALDSFEPKNEAIVDEKFASQIGVVEPIKGADSYLKLIKNDNDYIEYEALTNATNFGVLSEIFYTREGWHAYIDGKETTIYPTNYVLRGIVIPPGKHKIVFEFKPKSFYTVGWFTAFGNTALYALVIISLIVSILKLYKDNQVVEPEPKIKPSKKK